MKTINDLVDKLNDYYDMTCRVEKVLGDYNLGDDLSTYICFDNGDWDILSGFCMLHHEVQKEIMDFIYTTDSNHWFDEPEKKYNIIIGEDMSGNFKTVYYKAGNVVDVTDTAGEYELVSDQYQFTESEIEDLKTKVSERSAKIIDLGKVEIKDE